MRTIKISNQSSLVSPPELQACVLALQQQVTRDFAPRWNTDCQLVIAGKPNVGDEVIFLMDDADQAGALGYHTLQHNAPVGFVFVKTTLQAGDAWQATLSHELLEQLVDPWVNAAAVARWSGRAAALAMEVADPVENDEYVINGVRVSNFVLPTWFLTGLPPGPVDFLGKLSFSLTLRPGGYQSYSFDLRSWRQSFGSQAPHHQRWPGVFSRRCRRVQHADRL